jgi:hypothetical protein
MPNRTTRAAIYARVSTLDQTCQNQLTELREYVAARHWTAAEFVDEGVSGAKEQRPALDALLRAARRRQFDVVVCWRLDRLGRHLKHLIVVLEEFQVLGIAFVSLNEGIDATTPAGRLQMHILGAIAEFERARIFKEVIATGDPRYPYPDNSDEREALSSVEGERRVWRGAILGQMFGLRVASRSARLEFDNGGPILGFRLVVSRIRP